MDTVKKKLAQFDEAVKNAKNFLDNIDENDTNYDALIEECLQHRKNIHNPWDWSCWKYAHRHYFKPLNDSLLKPFLKKYPQLKRYDKHRIEYEHAVPEFLNKVFDRGDRSYILSFECDGEKWVDAARADAEDMRKKYEELKPQYEESRTKVDEILKYHHSYFGNRFNDISQLIVNTLALLKAKKKLKL